MSKFKDKDNWESLDVLRSKEDLNKCYSLLQRKLNQLPEDVYKQVINEMNVSMRKHKIKYDE